MSKKAFLIIFILSVITTYTVEIIQSFITHSVIAGEGGFPIPFTSSALFGTPSTNYTALFIDIVFWFMVISFVWFVSNKVLRK